MALSGLVFNCNICTSWNWSSTHAHTFTHVQWLACFYLHVGALFGGSNVTLGTENDGDWLKIIFYAHGLESRLRQKGQFHRP